MQRGGKTPPDGFRPAQESADAETGHWPGWIRPGDNPQYKWQVKAFSGMPVQPIDGSYEVCGPHIQGNPEGLESDTLIRHGCHVLTEFSEMPIPFSRFPEIFRGLDVEGVVWHHPDGRMAKIKKRDFGLKRKD